MILAAPLLIALLLPGCAVSIADGEIDQGQQRGLLEALQKLRMLNLGSGRLLRKQAPEAAAQPLPGQQVKAEQLSLDTVVARQSKLASQDLDSLFRNQMKRDQSLMVQINVFNSAGKGCWKRRKVLPHPTEIWPEATTAFSTAARSSQDTTSKTPALPIDSTDRPEDDMQQPDTGTTMYFPAGALDVTQNNPCEYTYGDGLNCDDNGQVYRAKASGIPSSPFDVLIGSVAAAVGGKTWQRTGAVAGDEPCQCSDTDLEAALKKRASTTRLPQNGRSSRAQLNLQKRLWPVPLVQKPVVRVFGSLRYPPTTDNTYDYATTYVYEDYYPTAYYEALPVQQKSPPAQYRPRLKIPSQPRSQPQAQPVKIGGVSLFHQPDVGVYAARVPNNDPAVGNKLLRPIKPAAGPTRTNDAAKKRVARDVRAVDVRAESMCPCSTTQKPPCTKTRKKCVKKPPCTKKVKKCKKPCPKKVEQPIMPYPYFSGSRIRR
ncbi:uncharacterized protein LOC144180003 [Haemaphysalis longicornis]